MAENEGEKYDELDPTDPHDMEFYEINQADAIWREMKRKSELEKMSSAQPTPPPEPPISRSGTQNTRIYYENPSEVIQVPRKSQIISILKRMLQKEGEVPDDFADWPTSRYYATYFELMGVEKYDPQKHS